MDLENIQQKSIKQLKQLVEEINSKLEAFESDGNKNSKAIIEYNSLLIFINEKIGKKEYDKYINTYNVIEYELASDLGGETTLASMPKDEDDEHYDDHEKEYEQQLVCCTAYINQLKRQFKKIPKCVTFYIFENDHDLGKYLEAGLIYDSAEQDDDECDEDSVYSFISECEDGLDSWDEIATEELKRYKYFD